VLHNAGFFGNSGLSIVQPLETTTNSLLRSTTAGLSDRQVIGGKLFETTLQWTRDRDSSLAKGAREMEVHPDMWAGNFYSDRRAHSQRARGAETIAWDSRTSRITHRIRVGGEFDWVSSGIRLDRRTFRTFGEDGDLKQLVTFAGPNSAAIVNREYGGFAQDRLVFNPKFQLELGARYDRERVAGRNNFAPRASASFLPFATSRAKISGGIGIFYENVVLLNLQLPRMQRRFTTVYEDGVPAPAPAATTVRFDPDLRNPRALHWNLAWENEWAPRWVTRIDYIQKRGRDQMRLAAQPNASGFDLVFNNSGKLDYRGVEISLDRPIRTNLRFLASYIYSKTRGRPSVSLDFPDPAVEGLPEVPVDWDTPHRFVGWGYFPLPSGLSASFSLEARSGFPFTPIDDLNRIAGGYNAQRLPAYIVVNGSVEKELPIPLGRGKRMAFRVGVTNLFNRFNPSFINRNVNSPLFLALSDSASRHFSARVRILKK